MWAEWHARAAQGDPADTAAEVDWLRRFMARIPCGVCRGHFQRLIDPVARGGFTDYFAATVAIHNAINTERGVAQFPIEDARALYS